MERPAQAGSVSGVPAGASVAGGPLVMTVGEAFVWLAVAVALPALAALFVAAAPRLAAMHFQTAPVFALTHTATLGWGSLTIMGAAYQMSSALLGTRLWGERWVPWQLVTYTLGASALVAGFWCSDLRLLAFGGTLVTLAAWAFVVIMVRTASALRRTAGRRTGPRQRVHGLAMALGVFAFGLVTAWGLVLALALRYPFWPSLYVEHRGLLVHLALGLGGWFGLMVVGVSYRLVPIVHGARIASESRGLAVVALLALAIALAVAGALSGGAVAGLLLRLAPVPAAVAAMLHSWEILRLLAHRRRRSPDLNVDHWYAVLGWSAALVMAGMAWAAGWLRTSPPDRLGVAAALVFLLGWVTQAILGQLYKVTPFLMWYYRARIPDVLAIPNLPDLYAPLPGRLAFWLTNAGVAAAAAGVLAASSTAVQVGAWLFAGGALGMAGMLGYAWMPAVALGRLRFGWRRAPAPPEAP